MRHKWTVSRKENEDFGDVEVYSVKDMTWSDWESIDVWDDGDSVRCVSCSSMLTAMRSDCPHSLAVKRFIVKSK